MKKFYFLILACFISCASFAQGILVLINQSEDFFDNLNTGKYADAQNLFDVSVKSKITEDGLKNLWASISTQLGTYEGVENAQNRREGDLFVVTLIGKFTKGKQAFRFVYNKSEKLVGFFVQPGSTQASYVKPAYADTLLYKEVSIKIANVKDRDLPGILTLPKKGTNFPVLVLVHGSGPGDMDETVGPNKPFKDLAAGLAAQGIATLRYVKRTRLYPADFTGAMTVKNEVLDDAVAAIALAKTFPQVNKKQVYVLGHSLGGMLAPRIAGLAPDIAGIILAAAPARKFTDVIVEQNINFFENSKDTTKEAHQQLDNALKMIDVTRISALGNVKADSILLGLPASYWVDINVYDQVAAAKKLKTKILVIQGEQDTQVSTEDFKLWKTALSTHKNAVFKLYPSIDHLLSPQTQKDWSGSYQKPSNVADYLITDIATFVKTP